MFFVFCPLETAREDGWFEGFDEGEVKGRNEAILEIVQKMQAEGVNPETIFRLTGYSESQGDVPGMD